NVAGERLRHPRALAGAGDELEQHHRSREDVGPGSDAARIERLFGRHVRRRAEHLPCVCHRVRGDVGHPEIEELRDLSEEIATRDEDVGWLEIAVDDAERMYLREQLEYLEHQSRRVSRVEGTIREALPEILAL